MTRIEASHIIYEIINSGIISEELEDNLQDIANTICEDSFEKCPSECSIYCEGCKFMEKEKNKKNKKHE